MADPQTKAGALGRRLSQMMEKLTLDRIGDLGLANAEANLPDIRAGKSILDLADGKLARTGRALVIAAGPSVHRYDTAKMILDSGFGGAVVTTESAMPWCLRNGIRPDLVLTVDPHAERIVRWFGDPTLTRERVEGDDYFTRQEMDPEFRSDQLEFNDKLLRLINENAGGIPIAVSSSASPAVVARACESGMDIHWWNPFYDDYDAPDSVTRQLYQKNRMPCVNAGGNVGTACWVFAHGVLGLKKVGLVGLDFGYYNDTTYKQSQYYTELVEIFGEDRLKDVYVHIHNPHVNKEFFTDPAYLWYRDVFLGMARTAREDGVRTYNCTGGGILFGEGIDFVTLDSFLAGRVG